MEGNDIDEAEAWNMILDSDRDLAMLTRRQREILALGELPPEELEKRDLTDVSEDVINQRRKGARDRFYDGVLDMNLLLRTLDASDFDLILEKVEDAGPVEQNWWNGGLKAILEFLYMYNDISGFQSMIGEAIRDVERAKVAEFLSEDELDPFEIEFKINVDTEFTINDEVVSDDEIIELYRNNPQDMTDTERVIYHQFVEPWLLANRDVENTE